MQYRPEIDGLRAVAVLAVVFYHCGFSRYIPGGFIGVDVFFVISGYLITGIIDRELRAGQFSLIGFYDRRVRRIIPALVVMVLATLSASFALQMPTEFSKTADGAISALLSYSNIYFFGLSGYFDAASANHPLLHTWSLAVEEQFYLVLPFLLLLMARNRIAPFALLAIAALLSLALSQWLVHRDMSAAYYMPYSRAWQLLIGSCVALLRPPVLGSLLANLATFLGLGLITLSMAWINARMPFPGVTALPACIGAALILHVGAAHRTMVVTLLSAPPFRFIGLISYSLYLWHWPIWVLGAEVYEPRSFASRTAYCLLMLGVAFLSWRFVERPFRRLHGSRSSKLPIAAGLASVMLVAVLAYGLRETSSSFWQVPPNVERVAAFSSHNIDPAIRAGKCFLTSADLASAYSDSECLHSSTDKRNILLVGDSHAAHLMPGFQKLPQINVLQATASGCKPLLNTAGSSTCLALMDRILTEFLPRSNVDAVILAGRWSTDDVPQFPKLLKYLMKDGMRVIVLGPTLEYSTNLPKLLATGLYRHDPSYASKHQTQEPFAVDALLKSTVISSGAEYISMISTICPDGICTQWTDDGDPLQFDYGHFTERGSELIVARLEKTLFGGKRDGPSTGGENDKHNLDQKP